MQRTELKMEEILERVRSADFGANDVVVAVGRGGIIPGAIISRELSLGMEIIWVRSYSDDMPPKKVHDMPKLVRDFGADVSGKRVLLVDDVARSGKTLECAKKIFLERGAVAVRTVAFVGRGADVTIFETDNCVKFPWD